MDFKVSNSPENLLLLITKHLMPGLYNVLHNTFASMNVFCTTGCPVIDGLYTSGHINLVCTNLVILWFESMKSLIQYYCCNFSNVTFTSDEYFFLIYNTDV